VRAGVSEGAVTLERRTSLTRPGRFSDELMSGVRIKLVHAQMESRSTVSRLPLRATWATRFLQRAGRLLCIADRQDARPRENQPRFTTSVPAKLPGRIALPQAPNSEQKNMPIRFLLMPITGNPGNGPAFGGKA